MPLPLVLLRLGCRLENLVDRRQKSSPSGSLSAPTVRDVTTLRNESPIFDDAALGDCGPECCLDINEVFGSDEWLDRAAIGDLFPNLARPAAVGTADGRRETLRELNLLLDILLIFKLNLIG